MLSLHILFLQKTSYSNKKFSETDIKQIRRVFDSQHACLSLVKFFKDSLHSQMCSSSRRPVSLLI